MPFIGNKPSAVPLTSADIADSIITSAKIVDGTITNTDVASSIITGQTSETSIAGGDSVLIYDDSASALRKMTRTNFVAGVGGAMTPAFEANIGSTQNVSSGTVTKAQFNTEAFDTDGCYDNATNYRFTPTTAGKYFVYLILTLYHPSNNNVQDVTVYLYKNGSAVKSWNLGNYASFSFQTISATIGTVINFNGSTDYVEAYGIIYGNATLSIGSGINNVFGAYKLIGV